MIFRWRNVDKGYISSFHWMVAWETPGYYIIRTLDLEEYCVEEIDEGWSARLLALVIAV